MMREVRLELARCHELGAYLASRAIDVGMLTFGFLLLGFGILYCFWLIKDYFDQEERARR